MKNFIPTSNQKFTFGDCKNCQEQCCGGIFGSTFSQILKEEFENIYENFPILFIFGSLNFIKPVILISNGSDFCPYLKNRRCTIYEKRPKVCQTYPLSPNLDNQIYIATYCPQVNKGENSLNFEDDIFKNYQEKYISTHLEFENLKTKDFEEVLSIRNIRFYKYIGEENSKYLNFHKLSLENLKRVV